MAVEYDVQSSNEAATVLVSGNACRDGRERTDILIHQN